MESAAEAQSGQSKAPASVTQAQRGTNESNVITYQSI